MIDYFVMEDYPNTIYRQDVHHVCNHWREATNPELNVNFIDFNKDEQLQHAIDVRQRVFTCEGSDIFILTDSDMLPFTKEQVELGIETLKENPEFAILSAWPEPHWIDSIQLEGRQVVNNEDVQETYSCGGFRFCRKVPGLICPPDLVKGYDGRFCRHLWREHGMRVGYLKKVKAFHLGAHCSTLWD